MGWNGGGEIWDMVAPIIHDYVPAGFDRRELYRSVRAELTSQDWDTTDEVDMLDEDMRIVWRECGDIVTSVSDEKIRDVVYALTDAGEDELARMVAGWDGLL